MTGRARVKRPQRIPLGIAVVFAMVGAGTRPSLADDLQWPEVMLPASASTGWITPETRFNGIPMRMRVFSLQWPTERVVDYFLRRWRINPSHDLWGPEQRGDRTWLMRSGNDFHISLSVRPTPGGAEGIVTVMPSRASWRQEVKTFFDVPAGLRLVLTQSSADGDSLILAGRLSPSADVEKLTHALEQEGWEVVDARRARTEPGAHIRFLVRPGERIQIVASRDGRHSLLLLNRIVMED
jgi:hypothetical protein